MKLDDKEKEVPSMPSNPVSDPEPTTSGDVPEIE